LGERIRGEYERWKEEITLSNGDNTQRMEKSFDIAQVLESLKNLGESLSLR